MLNRLHNYVVEQLAVVNESGRFQKPNEGLSHEMTEKSWAKYDNDLFQTGRLITCGLYINITLMDYLRTIVNLNRSNTTWTLDPRADMGNTKSATPSGAGNQVSAEFNLAYRWHSCISDKDDKWTQELYRKLFGKEAEDVTLQELLQGLGKWEQYVVLSFCIISDFELMAICEICLKGVVSPKTCFMSPDDGSKRVTDFCIIQFVAQRSTITSLCES